MRGQPVDLGRGPGRSRSSRPARSSAAGSGRAGGEGAFPPDTAVRLAQLRAETGLRMPDCCVLLSAEATGATVATFDDRLAASAEARNLAVRRRTQSS
ncbi:PIN domain-containing protein [Sporichthya sp.]|uniref:PIN domain-containing protein n=1 Tax=Sporichthya sp. TaxID=65475 RepID=UPI00345BEFA1